MKHVKSSFLKSPLGDTYNLGEGKEVPTTQRQ